MFCVCTCDYVQVYMYFMYIHAYMLLTYMDLQGYKNAYLRKTEDIFRKKEDAKNSIFTY